MPFLISLREDDENVSLYLDVIVALISSARLLLSIT